jgi:BolA protein
MSTPQELENRLREVLEPSHLQIIDDSRQHAGHAGARGGGHFTVTIVSTHFAGKTLVQRHRMVYDAVGNLMQDAIHALSIKAHTPEEFSA